MQQFENGRLNRSADVSLIFYALLPPLSLSLSLCFNYFFSSPENCLSTAKKQEEISALVDMLILARSLFDKCYDQFQHRAC